MQDQLNRKGPKPSAYLQPEEVTATRPQPMHGELPLPVAQLNEANPLLLSSASSVSAIPSIAAVSPVVPVSSHTVTLESDSPLAATAAEPAMAVAVAPVESKVQTVPEATGVVPGAGSNYGSSS